MAEECHDHKPVSLRTFKTIAAKLGEAVAWQLISLTKEAARDGLIKRSTRGAYLVGMAKQMAKERDIDLGFTPSSTRTV